AFVLTMYGPGGHNTDAVNSVVTTVEASTAVTRAEDFVVLASPGRIEAESDVVEVGAGIDGVIQSIKVKEGQHVAKGQVLAELDCRDLESSLPLAKSEAESLRQVRVRLLRGSRPEERQGALYRTAKAKANLEHATEQLDRQRQLYEAHTISKSAFEDANRDAGVAQSEYQLATRDEALVNAGPLPEEIAKADADVSASEKRIALAEDKLSKCVVKAPMKGTVLRVMLRQGESFALVSPKPILTMADISGRRVRAEVDERDVSKVHIGQTVVVSSEAFGGRRFTGTVKRVASEMGRKSVITGDPADKSDRDVLEVIAELDGDAVALPVGLRATVHFHR
ncbi:MAG TPA: efflux RND transporter periplasmic adaptor subunit, partial [Bryobacteraceae bacterium]